CEPRLHQPRRGPGARREPPPAGIPLPPGELSRVPGALPLAEEFDCLLGQSLDAALCELGLLARRPRDGTRDGGRRPTLLNARAAPAPSITARASERDAQSVDRSDAMSAAIGSAFARNALRVASGTIFRAERDFKPLTNDRIVCAAFRRFFFAFLALLEA